jgi:hypothetical protein
VDDFECGECESICAVENGEGFGVSCCFLVYEVFELQERERERWKHTPSDTL